MCDVCVWDTCDSVRVMIGILVFTWCAMASLFILPCLLSHTGAAMCVCLC